MATMTDPTNDQLLVPDPSFMDDYDFGGGSFVPPPQAKEPDPRRPGKFKYRQFVMQAPEIKDILTREDENGQALEGGGFEGRPLRTKGQTPSLKAVLKNIKLVESGYVVGQTHISAALFNKYDRSGQPTGEKRNASQYIEYLHAHGIDQRPATTQDYEEFVRATADREFQGRINWSAYDSENKASVAEKWEDFPDDPDNPGQKLPFIERDHNGTKKRFWARANVQGFVSTVERPKK